MSVRSEADSQPQSFDHPSIKRWMSNHPPGGRIEERKDATKVLDDAWLRKLCLEAGASDVGFVSIDDPKIATQREKILKAFPTTRSLISIVCRMNPDSVRTPSRSVANLEFHHATDEINEVARRIVLKLTEHGVRALNPSAGFPMEMDNFPDEQIWVVGHKPVAVAAGLGQMGIHRNVIHPKFGNFIILDTILVGEEVSKYGQPIDYNPCLSCKLCVAACPTGAIHSDGYFDFSACFNHNYREFMGGFNDWVGQVAESSSASDYRNRVSTSETASMWQSLSFGANYKAAYCVAVCPAGDDIIGQYLSNKSEFLSQVVRPLRQKEETIFVIPESDAEEFVLKNYPNKRVKRIHSGLRPSTIRGFLRGLRLVFQPGKSKGLERRFHFAFSGAETIKATVVIANQRLNVLEGHEGKPDLKIDCDSKTWLRFLGDKNYLPFALITRKMKLSGSPKYLLEFGKCFPS